jgi:hypothetical protein
MLEQREELSQLADEQARRAALRDPLRSSGGQHEAGRFRRGIAEFLRQPLLITLGFAVVGVPNS